jgi:branched-chain amino acid transport system substrate-binding protein
MWITKDGFIASRLIVGLLALVIVVSLLFSACSSSTTSPATTASKTTTQPSATTAPAAQKILKIGSIIPLNSPRGIQTANWYKLMAKLVNQAGGWKIGNDTYQIQMVIYDSQGNLQTAKDSLSRAVLNDGCKFLLSWTITGSADVDATVTEPNKVIVIEEDLTNQAVNPKYQYMYPSGNFFQNSDVYKMCQDQVKKGVKSYVSVKPDNQVGRMMDPMIDNAWKLANPNINKIDTVFVPMSTVDFGPIATKIKSYNPDCVDLIYLGFIPNSIPAIYRGLSDVGYKGTILPGLMSQDVLDALVTSVGKGLVEGGEVAGADVNIWQQDPAQRALIDAYKAEYGKWENDAKPDSFQILQAMINGAHSVDTDVIKAYWDKGVPSFQVLSGNFMYFPRPDVGNNRCINGCLGQRVGLIKDGKLVDSGTRVTLKDQLLFTVKTQNMISAYKTWWDTYGYPVFPASEKGLESLHFTDIGITGKD